MEYTIKDNKLVASEVVSTEYDEERINQEIKQANNMIASSQIDLAVWVKRKTEFDKLKDKE